MNLRRGSSLVLISLAFGASILSGVAATGVLDGGFSTLPPGANVQLSAEGTLDWVQWGLTGPDDVNRKAGVTPLISGITVIGEELVQWFDDNATGYTWTDGDPTPEADNATTGIYLVGQDNGFELTVPADTAPKTLKMYVGAYDAGMRFEATLSDSSAPAFVETDFRNVEDGPNAVFTLNYSAASEGQTLTIRLTVGELIGDGNVTLQAATLSPAAPALELVRPENDALFYPAANGLEFRARALAPRSIGTNQVRLILNDVEVTSQLIISGTETDRVATLAQLRTNVLYRATMIVTDDLSRSSTNTAAFDTFDSNTSITIEAEDYNYGDGVCEDGLPNPASTTGGRYQNSPAASGYDSNGTQVGGLQTDGTRVGYVGAVGLQGIDFNDFDFDPTADLESYRPCDPVVTGNDNFYFADTAPDLRRARFTTAGVRDFAVGSWDAGDWLNYTRSFAGSYQAYLRAATEADGNVVQLDRVTSDPALPDQTTEPLGEFALVRSGLLLGLRTIPLVGSNGESANVSLNGLQTLRLTAPAPAGQVSLNYLVLVPVEATPVTPPTLMSPRIAEGAFSFDFQSQLNTTYTVEFRESLPTGASDTWQQLESIVGDGTLKSFTNSAATPTGLFRVVVP